MEDGVRRQVRQTEVNKKNRMNPDCQERSLTRLCCQQQPVSRRGVCHVLSPSLTPALNTQRFSSSCHIAKINVHFFNNVFRDTYKLNLKSSFISALKTYIEINPTLKLMVITNVLIYFQNPLKQIIQNWWLWPVK